MGPFSARKRLVQETVWALRGKHYTVIRLCSKITLLRNLLVWRKVAPQVARRKLALKVAQPIDPYLSSISARALPK